MSLLLLLQSAAGGGGSTTQPSLRGAYSTGATVTKVLSGASWQAGDTILVFFVCSNSLYTGDSCAASGLSFTRLGGLGIPSCSATAFKAVAAANGSGDITVTSPNVNTCGVLALIISGSDGTVADFATYGDPSATTSHPSASVNAVADGAAVVFAFQDAATTTLTPASGWSTAGWVGPDGSSVPDTAFLKTPTTAGALSQTITSSASMQMGTLAVALNGGGGAAPNYNAAAMFAVF